MLETALISERAELVISILNRQLELMRSLRRLDLARRFALITALQGRTTGARDDALTTARELWLKQQLKAIRQKLREGGGGFVHGGGFVNGGAGGGLGDGRHGASGLGGGGAGRGGGLGGGGGGSGLGDSPPSAEAVEAGDKDEVAEVQSRLRTAQLPETARAVAERELRRLRQMQPMHAEYSVLLNYLDWLAAMPWGRTSEDQLDLSHAREVRSDCTQIALRLHSDCTQIALRWLACV